MASRVAAGLLRAIGLDELITCNAQEYEERAYHLATDADSLEQVRDKLTRNRLSTTLFDTEQQVRNIEAAYQTMWQRYETGLAPESFHVASHDVTS